MIDSPSPNKYVFFFFKMTGVAQNHIYTEKVKPQNGDTVFENLYIWCVKLLNGKREERKDKKTSEHT